MEEIKYLYSEEPFKWRKTNDGPCNHIYPKGTKVKIIGDSGYRGYDVEICETGVVMLETGLHKWSETPID